MASSPVNRKTIRKALAALLEANLVGTGLPVKAVYSANRRDFKTNSPVVCVISAGIARMPLGMTNTRWDNRIPMGILIYVLESKGEAGYTAEDAEDALDDVERLVSATIMDNRLNAGVWSNLTFDGEPTTIIMAPVGGNTFYLEMLTVWVEVHDA
jgi:hypothetical protein